MAVVKGVKEKVHLPLYDAISVKPGKRLGETLTSNVMRFFLDVTGKTKLQTNMQAASLLPHWNTYEARALRVVISDLPAQVPDTDPVVSDEFRTSKEFDITDPSGTTTKVRGRGKLTLSLRAFVELKRRIEGPKGQPIRFDEDRRGNRELRILGLTFNRTQPTPTDEIPSNTLVDGEAFTLDSLFLKDLEGKFRQAGQVVPTNEQIFPHDGFGTLIGKFVYNTVTTFFVGEKIMIQVPTYFFPAGAGPYSEEGRVTTHGYPNPQATFRFAEAVMIDAQQNFRVEIEVPESEVLSDLQRLYGPLFIWVVLDGYMTRDVQ